MAETLQRMTWERAKVLAERIAATLRPGCERVEIAGSIRRLKADVGDIEIVAIPKRAGFFEESALDPILQSIVDDGRFARIKNGDKYKQFLLPKSGCKLDLFLCEPETWGVIFTLRTGPADFSQRLVTQRCKGGLLPSDLRVQDGRVRRRMDVLDTPEEADFFRVAEVGWMEPEDRHA